MAPILGLMVFASGCCCVQPCATSVCCDPCVDTCGDSCGGCGDCGDCCEETCGPTCGPCMTPCCQPCWLLAPIHWVGGLLHGACNCDSGCGELYWGGWHNYPPCHDPCDPCSNWVGDGGLRCDQEGCCGQGCSAPMGGCADCQTCQNGTTTRNIPSDAEMVSQTDRRVASAASPAGSRVPTKASPRPVKKSPQAMRPYYARPRR